MFILSRPVYRLIEASISKYCSSIAMEFDALYEKMESVKSELSSIITKNSNIEDEILRILNVARLEIKLSTNKDKKDLLRLVEIKLKKEQEKIEYNNSIVLQKLKEKVVDISARYVYQLATLKLTDNATQSFVINRAITQIPKKIH